MLSDQVLEYLIDLRAAGILNVFGVWEGHLAYASEIAGAAAMLLYEGFVTHLAEMSLPTVSGIAY